MASNTIAKLHDGYVPTSAASALWAPTASTSTMIKQIVMVNHGGGDEAVQLFIDAAGSPANDATVFKATLGAGESAVFEGILVMNDGEEMYGSTDTASTVSISVHGMEMA